MKYGIYPNEKVDAVIDSFGSNSIEELGLNLTTEQLPATGTPQTTTNNPIFEEIALGQNTAIAIDRQGRAWGWGSNIDGVLGFQDPPNDSWMQISSGPSFTVGIKSNGLMFSWGAGPGGQLGVPTLSLTKSYISPVQIGTLSWKQVACGQQHVLAIRNDNLLFAWGVNSLGHLGDGTTISKSSPIQVGTSQWSQIAAGGAHSAAITIDNRLFTWGSNTAGQLGDNTTVGKSSPVLIAGTSWTQVACGSSHTVGYRQGAGLYAWGLNAVGQLGDNTTVGKSSPVLISGSAYTQIVCGQSFTAGIVSNADLFTWGLNTAGQLGTGDTTNRSTPTKIGAAGWQVVRAAQSAVYALNANQLYGWGAGGLLSDAQVTQSSPILLSSAIGLTFNDVYAGSYATCAFPRQPDGRVFVFGNNSNGQAGSGGIVSPERIIRRWQYLRVQSSPKQLLPNRWKKISVGQSHSVGIDSQGFLWTWGNRAYSGVFNTADQALGQQIISPVQIGTSKWKDISVSAFQSLAVRDDGILFSWGFNQDGVLGQSTAALNSLVSNPVQVDSQVWKKVSAGIRTSAAIRSDGILFMWGANLTGALGRGAVSSQTQTGPSIPTQVDSNIWDDVSAGAFHTAGRRGNKVFMTGYNGYGQLGFTTPDNRQWIMISRSPNGHTLAIDNAGKLWAWGLNSLGQLGDGTTVNKSSPVQIGNSNWSVVSAGANYSLAIRSDGLLFAWGSGTSGQLGDGTIASKSSPIQIGTSSWIAVSAGKNSIGSSSGAIRVGGNLFMWGRGQIMGDGTTVDKSSPVQIGALSWRHISVGSNHATGIAGTNQLYAWGLGSSGELGDNTNVSKSSPVQVPGSYATSSSGTQYTMAITTGGALFTWGAAGDYSGIPGTANRSTPTQVGNLSNWTAVDATNYSTAASRFTYARNSVGELYAFGANTVGQLGTGNTVSTSTPTLVASGVNSFNASGGSTSSGACSYINSSGIIFTTGAGINGSSGDGTTLPRSFFTQLGTFNNVYDFTVIPGNYQDAKVGQEHTIALGLDSRLYAWGRNNFGQAGQSTLQDLTPQTRQNSPISIIGNSVYNNVYTKFDFNSATRKT